LKAEHELGIDGLCQQKIDVATTDLFRDTIEIFGEENHPKSVDHKQNAKENPRRFECPAGNRFCIVKKNFENGELGSIPKDIGKNLNRDIQSVFKIGDGASFEESGEDIEISHLGSRSAVGLAALEPEESGQ